MPPRTVARYVAMNSMLLESPNGDPVSGNESESGKPAGESVDVRVELGPGDPPVAVDESNLVSHLAGSASQQVRDVRGWDRDLHFASLA